MKTPHTPRFIFFLIQICDVHLPTASHALLMVNWTVSGFGFIFTLNFFSKTP
jgi:hypothetical protein